MEVKILLLAALTFALNSWTVSTEEEVIDCMDAAYCSLIKGDIAKESTKYNHDPKKFYAEAEDFRVKATEYNKTKDDSIAKGCQSSYKTCIDEAATMAIDGLGFPDGYRTICNFEEYSRTIFGCQNLKNWPVEVRQALPDKRLTCRQECVILGAENYTLSNGKALVRVLSGEDMKMTDLPSDLETRVRSETNWNLIKPVNRPGVKWLLDGFIPGTIFEHDGSEVCPPNSWVDTLTNFNIVAGLCPRLHVDFVCRYPTDLGTKKNQGHILGIVATILGNAADVNTTTQNSGIFSPNGGFGGHDCIYKDNSPYENCNGIPGRTQNTFLTGVSLTKQGWKQDVFGVYRVNYLCGDSKDWKTKNGKVDSNLKTCPSKMAVCGIRTTSGLVYTNTGPTPNIRDMTIGCCDVDERYITTAVVPVAPVTPPPVLPVTQPPAIVVPVTSNPGNATVPATPPSVVPVNPVPPSVTTEGENGLFTLQRNFLLFWAGVLSSHITRYNYFYSPHTIDKETDWETTKCANGTFVNGFEVTNPISLYHWTRRIMVLKFKCGAVDGSKSADLDLYTKLKTGKYSLQDPDLNEKSDCAGGYYSTMELIYYLDKTRQKAALVNAWGISMKCTKGGSADPHTHTVNSTPRNVIAENTIQNGVVDCGTGKAICGFANKLAESRRGAFEGLYYRVICCAV